MSISIEQFDGFFKALHKDKNGEPIAPFPWQTRLARRVFAEGWPDCIDLPTASGKTACIDIAVFVLACQARFKAETRTVGRRIFFAVNRRVIVDEAFERARRIAQALLDAGHGILKEVADALRSLNENGDDRHTPPLDVAQLRGGIYRDTSWARSLTQPMVFCTTADQLGSRLLFRGYGVSDSMKPIHAALCGCDSLVLLDEAHVTRAFSQTMQLLPRYQLQHKTVRPLTFVQMTATPAGEVKNRFELNDEDLANKLLSDRQAASKPASLVKLDKKKSIVDEIVSRAAGALSDTRKAIGIIVNRVQTARLIEAGIRTKISELKKKDETFDADVHLIIGRMRPTDRDVLQDQLRAIVGSERPGTLDKPVFVVATQCLEVGADYDFDALITECASIDALRQRFGRLNRKGREIDAIAAIVTNDESIKGEDPIYGDAIKHTWEWLSSKQNDKQQIDFGINLFRPLWQEVERKRATYLDESCPKPLLAPAPNAAVLLPAHLDALCQTSPQPVPSPDVSYFIHGPQRDNAEVNVCWRADLGDDSRHWPEIVRLLPPTSPECMTVPLRDLRRWMLGSESKPDRDADVPVAETDEDDNAKKKSASTAARRVVIWRGTKDVQSTTTPLDLRPGDTVVLRTVDGGWDKLGHIPGAPTAEELDSLAGNDDAASVRRLAERIINRDRVDVAEAATRESRRRLVIRLHPAFEGRADLRGLKVNELRERLVSKDDLACLKEEWPNVAEVVRSRVEPHAYPQLDAGDADDSPEGKPDEVLVFKRLLESKNKLVLPARDEDDEDTLSQQDRIVSLELHTRHVVDRLVAAIEHVHVNGRSATFKASADFHDLGKADIRFQAMLAGITPAEAMERPTLLGKGDGRRLTLAELKMIFDRAAYPIGFRHEMLSTQMVEYCFGQLVTGGEIDRDLLLHLIAAHHGHARPFAPVVIDGADDDTLSIEVNGISLSGAQRKAWPPAHRLDSGVGERFWDLTRAHGWWGLAYLESILRLADQQASAAEQERANP